MSSFLNVTSLPQDRSFSIAFSKNPAEMSVKSYLANLGGLSSAPPPSVCRIGYVAPPVPAPISGYSGAGFCVREGQCKPQPAGMTGIHSGFLGSIFQVDHPPSSKTEGRPLCAIHGVDFHQCDKEGFHMTWNLLECRLQRVPRCWH